MSLDHKTKEAYDAKRDFSSKGFRAGCYAPFNSLFFNTDGKVCACCKSWAHPLGSLEHERIDDIWNGAQIKEMRKSLANYDFGNSCEHCAWQIESGDYSGVFAHVFDLYSAPSSSPEWPSMMQFAVSNTCNLECVMCNGDLSSKIRAREKREPLPRVWDEQAFADLRKYLPHLEMAQFFGGEPFYSRECFRIWEMMIEEGLTTRCHVSTNGTHYNERVERVLAALPFSITVSVDGATKETVESIRVGARYEDVMRNIIRFRDYTRDKRTYLCLSYCLIRQNWEEFVDFLLFAEEVGCSVFVNTVIDPPNCSLFTLPSEELQEIADEIASRGETVRDKLLLNEAILDQQITVLRNNAAEQSAKEAKHRVYAEFFGD